MVSVEEAESIILSNPFPARTQNVPLEEAAGRVLAEPVFADRDFPPFDRVTMDGIAIRFASLTNQNQAFIIEGTQAAGQSPLKLKHADHCIEVMTGAMLPEGTDTVIRYEDVSISDGVARVAAEVTKGQSIHVRGQDARQGQILLEPGLTLSAAEIALLASVGKKMVTVVAYPSTAIISTGDELVDIRDTPLPWQVRRSNSYALQAAFRRMQIDATLFHVPDQRDVLATTLADIFQRFQIVVLSGGISKGKFDYVPEALEKLGIRKLFQGVSQRPGKPFWFGKSSLNTVFALPGNPVSTYLCFYRYIKPWIEKSTGLKPKPQFATLARDFKFQPPLSFFLQVKIENKEGRLLAHPDEGGGSGDFVNLKDIDGFIELPKSRSEFQAGESFLFYPFR